jgi:hypothetical protein
LPRAAQATLNRALGQALGRRNLADARALEVEGLEQACLRARQVGERAFDE